jgi:hypothetical protein
MEALRSQEAAKVTCASRMQQKSVGNEAVLPELNKDVAGESPDVVGFIASRAKKLGLANPVVGFEINENVVEKSVTDREEMGAHDEFSFNLSDDEMPTLSTRNLRQLSRLGSSSPSANTSAKVIPTKRKLLKSANFDIHRSEDPDSRQNGSVNSAGDSDSEFTPSKPQKLRRRKKSITGSHQADNQKDLMKGLGNKSNFGRVGNNLFVGDDDDWIDDEDDEITEIDSAEFELSLRQLRSSPLARKRKALVPKTPLQRILTAKGKGACVDTRLRNDNIPQAGLEIVAEHAEASAGKSHSSLRALPMLN